MNLEEVEKLAKENRKNLNKILELIKVEDPEPPDPKKNICKFPLSEKNYILGWSGLGYEALSLKEYPPAFTEDLYREVINESAKFINFRRYFAYCSENLDYLKATISPFPGSKGSWTLREISKEYKEVVGSRLREDHSRKVATMVCIATGIKGTSGRWNNSYFNGANNVNDTTTDFRRFYDHPKTVEMFDIFLENYVTEFDSPHLIYELVNEASQNIYSWAKGRIQKLVSLGVPRNRISLEIFQPHSKYAQLLEEEEGLIGCAHAVNSLKTVNRWHTSADRKFYYDLSPRFHLSGDGPDEFNEALGLKGLNWNAEFRKCSARQMRNMVRHDIQTGGGGIEFMSALAYLNGKLPDLRLLRDHMVKGFTAQELTDLSSKLGIPLDAEQNKCGELLEIRDPFNNNFEL